MGAGYLFSILFAKFQYFYFINKLLITRVSYSYFFSFHKIAICKTWNFLLRNSHSVKVC